MIAAVEQVVLVRPHLGKFRKPALLDVDMAGGAAAAAAADRQELIEAGASNILHHAPAGAPLDGLFVAVAIDDDELRHISLDAKDLRGSGGGSYARRGGDCKRERELGIRAEDLHASLDALAAREPLIAAALERAGYPEPRISERGYQTLLRAIVGQQVSIKAAASMWAKLTALVGDPPDPQGLIAASDEALRGAGLSRQKASYARSLAEEVVCGRLDFEALPKDDEEAIAHLVAVKGIGRWTAEIYLLFAEGRPDVWPAGDLAIQLEVARIMGLDEERPSEKRIRALSEAWRPHRGALAIFAWHYRRAGQAAI